MTSSHPGASELPSGQCQGVHAGQPPPRRAALVHCQRVVTDLVIVSDTGTDMRFQTSKAEVVEDPLNQPYALVVDPVYSMRDIR